MRVDDVSDLVAVDRVKQYKMQRVDGQVEAYQGVPVLPMVRGGVVVVSPPPLPPLTFCCRAAVQGAGGRRGSRECLTCKAALLHCGSSVQYCSLACLPASQFKQQSPGAEGGGGCRAVVCFARTRPHGFLALSLQIAMWRF